MFTFNPNFVIPSSVTTSMKSLSTQILYPKFLSFYFCFFFTLWPAGFDQGFFDRHEYGAIHWNMRKSWVNIIEMFSNACTLFFSYLFFFSAFHHAKQICCCILNSFMVPRTEQNLNPKKSMTVIKLTTPGKVYKRLHIDLYRIFYLYLELFRSAWYWIPTLNVISAFMEHTKRAILFAPSPISAPMTIE